jgi:hypothetical protein
MATLPATSFEACDRASGRVISRALVRDRTSECSPPVACGHRDVRIRARVDRRLTGCGGEIIARHARSCDREDMVFDPVRYLSLIVQKFAAFEQAAPLTGWDLPKAFTTLQKLMEARMLKAGRREYVQVLRLLESFEMEEVHAAVRTALQMGTISFDAVKHLALCRIERRPPRLGLDIYPYLPRAEVQMTSPTSHMCLTTGGTT